ncbi:MAG: hypothetical protein J6Q39_08185 [Bacteroidales bacterium]|nr:hypothetical protein [Bacteroidales bacterium]
MVDFKMSRNGSGYYDETAYRAINEMAKPGEIWSYLTNNGFRKDVLIIKNHGTFCSALSLVDEDSSESIEVRGLNNFSKYTDPRMVQYIYNSNLAQRIALVDIEEFDEILKFISNALSLSMHEEFTEKATVNHRDCFDEMVALFGEEAFENYCKCSYLFHILNGEPQSAEHFMNALKKILG